MTESTVPVPEPGAVVEPEPVPVPEVVEVDLDFDAMAGQASGGLSVGRLLDALDLQPSLAHTMQDAVAAVTADGRGSLSTSPYEAASLGTTVSTVRLLGESLEDFRKTAQAPLITSGVLLTRSFAPERMFGGMLRLNDQLSTSFSRAAGLEKTFSTARLLGGTFDSITTPMIDLGASMTRAFGFHLNTVFGSLGDLWATTLFDQVRTWLADVDFGGLARTRARQALAAVRRARQAALDGRMLEVERFIRIYLYGEVEAYLTRLGEFERGAVAGYDYRRDEAVNAVVMALLCLPPLPDDAEADGLVVLDEIGRLIRSQMSGFRSTWDHVHRGVAVLSFGDLAASAADTPTDVDLLPGEYADDRLGHVARMLKPDELAVIETYADNLGSMTWTDAAAAAGHPDPDRFGAHVRRKRKTLTSELERRAVAQTRTENRFGARWH